MKISHFFLLLMVSSTSLFAKDNKEMERAGKEAKKVANTESKKLLKKLKKLVSEEDSLVSKEDFLPAWDRGKTFSYKGIEEDPNYEIAQLRENSKKREKIEEKESYFAPTELVVEDLKKTLGILKEEEKIIPEEKLLQACHEGGEFQACVIVNRLITIHPEKRRKAHICQGHKSEESFFSFKSASKYRDKQYKNLQMDTTVSPDITLSIKGGGVFSPYLVSFKWKHLHGTRCDRSKFVDELLSERKETDIWKPENPETLKFLEEEPSCQLLYKQPLIGQETRLIGDESVFRETWKERLFFKCQGSPDTKCQVLRNQGAILVQKKCIKESPFGECITWEKIYDLGKKRASLKTEVIFEEQELYGFNNPPVDQEANREFGQVMATFSTLPELERDLQENDTNIAHKRAEIFKGEHFECSRSLIHGILYDCCRKMNGIAISSSLAECTSEEKCLAKHRYDGKCHFIGTKRNQLETKQVYCCFPTKLARIIQEEGKMQLQYSWGSPARPNCRGFSAKQLRRIDFSKMDLTEILEDLQINKSELLQKLKSNIQPEKMVQKSKIHTEQLIQNEARKIDG